MDHMKCYVKNKMLTSKITSHNFAVTFKQTSDKKMISVNVKHLHKVTTGR